MMKRAILGTKNEHVDELNTKMIKIFPSINIHIDSYMKYAKGLRISFLLMK